MEPLLFSSRTIFERLPVPSAVNRPPVEIGPLELEPPIKNAKLPMTDAVVNAMSAISGHTPASRAQRPPGRFHLPRSASAQHRYGPTPQMRRHHVRQLLIAL